MSKKTKMPKVPKEKKPLYKRKWVWILGAVILVAAIGGGGSSDEKEDQVQTQEVAIAENAATTNTTASDPEPEVVNEPEPDPEPVEEEKEPEEVEYKIAHGELLSAITNVIDGKSVLVVKTKIEPSLTNDMTIKQNFFNIETLVQNGADGFDEIQYWAIADMTSGKESKVISFTVPKWIIERIADKNYPSAYMEDDLEDFWVLPSLKS